MFAIKRNRGGQAIVEYLLGLTLVILLVGMIATVFRKSLYGMWEMISRDVSAACPGCPPDPKIRLSR